MAPPERTFDCSSLSYSVTFNFVIHFTPHSPVRPKPFSVIRFDLLLLLLYDYSLTSDLENLVSNTTYMMNICAKFHSNGTK